MIDELRRKLAQGLATARGLNQASLDSVLAGNSESKNTIPFAPKGTLIPLSHAQERMWFLHKLDPAASAYNVCVLWQLQGDLNAEALRRSANRLAERHSIFRTLYNTDDAGRAQQEILPSLPPSWRLEDLRSFDPEERAQRLDSIAQQASTAAFDLGKDSPLRLVLVVLSDLHHVLVMVGQHIVWDGPSFGVFSQELANGYNVFLNNQPDHYALPPIQYVDFADWHRKQWQDASAKRTAELTFWESQLQPLPEPLDFPVDFERNTGEDEAGEWCTESLDATTTAALLQLTAQEKLTPFEVVISTIALLMTRLGRASEVTIGTVASLRNLPELNGVIGNFGNVVPLRLPVSNHWSFRELIQHCAARCRAAFAHADMPFEYLLDHLNITRGATRNPLLDTMVTFLSHGMGAPKMEGLDVRWEKHFNDTSQIDLSFDALLQNGCLQLQATWRRSLYRPETVPNHLRRLAQLLRECVANPDARLTERQMLLPAEHRQLTQSWGVRPAMPTDADTLVSWFENTVRKQPDATALYKSHQGDANTNKALLSNQTQSLSFAVLNARANRLARWLITQGIGPEDRVAVSLSRKPEWFIAMLATLKAGAAFVPIDPTYPADYINRVITLAEPILTFLEGSEELDPSHAVDKSGISVDLTAAENAASQAGLSDHDLSNSERRVPLRSDHPVYVVFTSGSTGKPKGVVVTHSALVNLLASHREDLYEEAYRRTGRRHLRIGHAWSLAFDASWQPNLWLFEGHELHLFDVDVMQDPIALAREIIQRRLDFIELTPGMLDEVLPWLQSGLTEPGGHHLPSHVPAILAFGGEAVKHALWQRILKLENTTGFNLYGPTEACVDTMIARVNANEPPNIGRPVAGAEAYVLDSCLQLTPPGVAGELAISGEGLARGYLTRGDLTASQFIANPHGADGTRLYRTGDRVRWLPGGLLEYIGRIDEQVKIRGFRVEPLEVEATVEKLAHRPCAVVARKSNSGTLQLLCFVETNLNGDNAEVLDSVPDLDTLQQLCSSALPAHLVPSHIISIQRLPRLPNGKINRRALTMPEGLENASGRSPRNPLEQQLCRLMAEVLGREQISIDDGFFELGGDSISVIKLVSLARRDGVSITARQVFDTRSVARLASLLESTMDRNALSSSLTHDNADTGLGIPTPLMTRYLSAGLPLTRFAQIVSLPLPKGISDQQLGDLLNALIQRHALLRARLVAPEKGLAYLEIPVAKSVSLSVKPVRLDPNYKNPADAGVDKDLPSLTSDTLRLNAVGIAKYLCHQLDPASGVMLAAAHVHDELNASQSLWLAVSHLVIDVGSWHILVGDLALARAAQERGKTIELPPVPTAWRSWSSALKQSFLEEVAVPSKPRGTLATARRMSWVLPQKQGQCPAAALARRLGLPISSLLPAITALAALKAGLIPDHYNRTVYLAIERQGREPSVPTQDLSRTVGWFAREVTLPLQSSAEGLDSVAVAEALNPLLRQWCSAIAQLDEPSAQLAGVDQSALEGWQLGFNFLGDFTAAGQEELWTPQPRMDLLVEACGEHWPLLHDLDVSAHYAYKDGARLLQFDAVGSNTTIDNSALNRLAIELQKLLDALSGINAAATERGINDQVTNDQAISNLLLKEVTPLQFEILRHCSDESDPWTTQMELTLVVPAGQAITEASLKQSAGHLLSRHESLRAGFLTSSAATFIALELKPDWQSIDLRGRSEADQQAQLIQIRDHWYSYKFNLHQPPLLRFMAVQLSDDRWQLLVNCHHLLLDGWSVPRVLHEWLAGANGQLPASNPELRWTDYLDWLQTQDRATALRYWNHRLRGLDAPSLLRPARAKRLPTVDLKDSLSVVQSRNLVDGAKKAGVSPASLYQLAWAKTLAEEIGHGDIVFGLFDSGRAAPVDGLATLVGLVTQLIPMRVDTATSLSVTSQLRELQAQQFESQAQVPIRLDNLDVALRFGELFDSLLVIENALDADSTAQTSASNQVNNLNNSPNNPLSMLHEQQWRDSIGQVVGLFIYPGNTIALRLCRDPDAVSAESARHLFTNFTQHLQHLINELSAELSDSTSARHQLSSYTAETSHE
jgi:amino acid adenylation domain-containing protein